jgi:hypothetical protein
MSKRSSGWTAVSAATVLVSICLGVAYAYCLSSNFCWECQSADQVYVQGVDFDHVLVTSYKCEKCGKSWAPLIKPAWTGGRLGCLTWIVRPGQKPTPL